MGEHLLEGCRSKPMSGYLKALGIIRLIHEQKDKQVRGLWKRDTFALLTKLDVIALENFFCDEYSPTPILSPWNGGSGFYPGDATAGLNNIISDLSERFKAYRTSITEVKSWPGLPCLETVSDVCQSLSDIYESMSSGRKKEEVEKILSMIDFTMPPPEIMDDKDPLQIKLSDIEDLLKGKSPESKKLIKAWRDIIKKARTKVNMYVRSKNKESLLPKCRSMLSDKAILWIDAICALRPEGVSYNRVLGTGGNEGRLEISNNFMQRVSELLITGNRDDRLKLLRSAIFGNCVPGLVEASIGQYDPGRAGGYNQGMEIETKNFKINPWDYILSIEGVLVLSGAIARRYSADERAQLTTPFTVNFSPVGFSTNSGQEKGRHETWLPIWKNPASYPETQYLFGEGKASIGRRMARNGLEFSRAVSTFGTDRGIEAFERYAFLERRGQSYIAMPLGRIHTSYKPDLELLKEFDSIVFQLRRFIKGFKILPATFSKYCHQIDEALFICNQNADSASFVALVRALGRIESAIAERDRYRESYLQKPLFGLSPRWVKVCDDGGPEVRLAAALASIKATGGVGPIRSTVACVDAAVPWQWGRKRNQKSWYGNSLPERLSYVLLRRLREAEQTSTQMVPVEAVLPICPEDVELFISGDCDDGKIEDLFWGFTLIDWKKGGLREIAKKWSNPLSPTILPRAWCLLKLLHTPEKIRGIDVRRESRIISLLSSGRIREACDLAHGRLKIANLTPYKVTYESNDDPVRLLASLLIPIKDQWKLECRVLKDEVLNNRRFDYV